jgi:hypothetical protein
MKVSLVFFKQGKRFFFEKKKQKTFAPLGHGRSKHPGPDLQSFLQLFVHRKQVFLSS